ncbi:hypothetical protein MK805_16475 [Shimazuella sp. AN120528]|uniref:hypothetical protein n=1 Tax=Shimazuella soli TaxID=1892854 RepID=UPI001F0D12B4|nr:hypothetical protein [Shimazuella soli]MCH5586535.1 hypothetical protein [Shimazuella soli]
MFFLAIISFFIFAISGIQLVAGGYVIAGVPVLAVSGVVPLLSSFWSSRRYKKHSGGEESGDDGCSICDSCECLDNIGDLSCFDLGDCDCGCD